MQGRMFFEGRPSDQRIYVNSSDGERNIIMNIEKYTDRAKGFIQAAQNLALREGHQQLTPEHLLKVLLGIVAALVWTALVGLVIPAVRRDLDTVIRNSLMALPARLASRLTRKGPRRDPGGAPAPPGPTAS